MSVQCRVNGFRVRNFLLQPCLFFERRGQEIRSFSPCLRDPNGSILSWSLRAIEYQFN